MALAAKLKGASILLRLDDLDQARYRREYADDIFQTLDFLGLSWDEGPGGVEELEKKWSQKHRLDLYESHLQDLAERKLVFACECSRSDIAEESKDGTYPGTCCNKDIPLKTAGTAWRLFTDEKNFSMLNWDGAAEQELSLPPAMHYFVVKRKDGLPAYQLASLADDIFFGVNMLVRGRDLWDSSLAQLFLAQKTEKGRVFGRSLFFHHRLLTGEQGDKLSKSVLQQSRQLRDTYSTKEIYRAYSRFIKLEKESESLSELKDMVSEQHLLGLSKP